MLDDLRNIATIAGVIVALFTFLKGVIEYMKQGSQKRAELFNTMRKKYKENENFKNIRRLLEKELSERDLLKKRKLEKVDEDLKNVNIIDKMDYIGFFEEIALMMNSKIIKKEIVHHMFAYYAILCYDSTNFWLDGSVSIEKDNDIYLHLFKEFVTSMKKIEEKQMNENNKKNKLKVNKYKF